MRFPGTCSRYSKKAMPQLRIAARYQGRSARFFRCAYQAKVMKTFEAMSSSVALSTGLMAASGHGDAEGCECRAGAGGSLMHHALPAALARAGDVVGTVIDEYRGGGLESEAALGLLVDPRMWLHDAGEERWQRAVADGMHAKFTRQLHPVQIADVRQQIHAIV